MKRNYSIVMLIFLIYFVISFLTNVMGVMRKQVTGNQWFTSLKNRTVVLFFIGIFCYVGTEQGVANWISEFLSSYHGMRPEIEGAQANL